MGSAFITVCSEFQLNGDSRNLPEASWWNAVIDIVARLDEVNARIAAAETGAGRPRGSVTLVAVTKTFGAEEIAPVIDAGQRVFGENRVQEAQAKWPALKQRSPDIELRLIGPLQSNKAKEAVALFDVIETVDREKIAAELAREMRRQGREPRLDAGLLRLGSGVDLDVEPREAAGFVARCREVHGLMIEGLMCIPPFDRNPGPNFALLEKIARESGVEKLSMGMSGDYETAIAFGATSVRVGSAIFGAR